MNFVNSSNIETREKQASLSLLIFDYVKDLDK